MMDKQEHNNVVTHRYGCTNTQEQMCALCPCGNKRCSYISSEERSAELFNVST